MKQDGIIHIYRGDGKGKTTAAVGLACRALGRELRVLFVQFLKSRETGEIASLRHLGAHIIRSEERFGFVINMSDEERQRCVELHHQLLRDAQNNVAAEAPDMVILDEVLDALSLEMISEEALRSFIEKLPAGCELVCTGHVVIPWLEEQAGYITEMCKHRHPYNDGVKARAGVEY